MPRIFADTLQKDKGLKKTAQAPKVSHGKGPSRPCDEKAAGQPAWNPAALLDGSGRVSRRGSPGPYR